MKITELIFHLEMIKEKHGDLDTFMEIEETEIDSVCGEIYGLKLGKSFMRLRNGVYFTNKDIIEYEKKED